MAATKHFEVWKDQPERVHHDCCRMMVLEERKRGFTVYFEGEPVAKWCFVLEGSVRLTSGEDTLSPPRIVKAGECFGSGPNLEFLAEGKKFRRQTAVVNSKVACRMAVVHRDNYVAAHLEHLERTFKPVMDFLKKCPVVKAAQLVHEASLPPSLPCLPWLPLVLTQKEPYSYPCLS